jgi:hypothetical protein
MSYILLVNKSPLYEEDMRMQKLYERLWDKRNEVKVILDDSYKVPQLPSMDLDGQAVLSTQVGVDPDIEMYTEPHATPYKFVQLPDGLALPTIAREPPRETILVRSCYDEILDIILRERSPAAVLGSPGIGEHILYRPLSFGSIEIQEKPVYFYTSSWGNFWTRSLFHTNQFPELSTALLLRVYTPTLVINKCL